MALNEDIGAGGSCLILQFDRTDLAALEDAAPVAAATCSAFRTRLVRLGCFDTEDFALRGAGVILSVRRQGKRFIQILSVPAADDATGGVESSAEVAGFAPDPAVLDEGFAAPLQDALHSLAAGPAFTIRLRRRICRLDIGGSIVGLAIDRGVIEVEAIGDEGRSVPISEVRLTLVTGQDSAVFEAAQRIFEVHRFNLSGASQIARGFALARNQPPECRKSGAVGFDAEGSADAAMVRVLRACQDHALANLDAAIDGRDPEGVHQLRVGLRRVRSGLRLLRGIMPQTTLRGFMDDARSAAAACGAARGWDVFLGEALPDIADRCAGFGDFEALRAAAEIRRGEAYAAVRSAVIAEPHVRFHLALGAWIGGAAWRDSAAANAGLAGPVTDFAAAVLTENHRRVRKRGRRFRKLSASALHRLRIAAKNLRYSADCLRAAIDDRGGRRKATRRYFRHLARLQEELGRTNDMAATSRLIEEITGDGLPPKAWQASGAVIGWEVRGLAEAAPDLEAAWLAFRREEPPWRRKAAAGPSAETTAQG